MPQDIRAETEYKKQDGSSRPHESERDAWEKKSTSRTRKENEKERS